jgi:hypothetical protein
MVIEGEISMTQLYKNNVLTLGMLSIWVKRYQEGGLQASRTKESLPLLCQNIKVESHSHLWNNLNIKT